MAVFIGVNGSGKSTLLDIFSFLKDALTNNVKIALDRWGGFKEVVSRGKEGSIELEFSLRLDIPRNPKITYRVKISYDKEKKQPFID